MRAVLGGVALTALLAAACGGGDEPAAPRRLSSGDWPLSVQLPGAVAPRYERVILVTIDTLRADHVSCYGYPRVTTPFLDSLAARGARFRRASATISHTAPSHSSMLTGVPPLVHGVLQNGYRMDADAIDLARVFAGAGFETAACVNTEFLAGVAASFQTVRATTEIGEEVLRQARGWLESDRTSARFFLWVHFFDPHRWKDFATEVQEEHLFRGKTPPGFREYVLNLHGLDRMGIPGLLAQRWETVLGKSVQLESVAQYLRFVEAYDALIQYADRQLQALHEAVEGLGLPGATLWVVTADHGEGLASHGTDGHGAHLYEEQLSVPLVFFASDGSLEPRTVDALATHLDLFPTLLETLGARAEAPEGVLEGRSLWPLLRGERGWTDRAVFAQRKPTGEALYSLRGERFKLLDLERGADEFYDLARDPRELDDLAAPDPEAAAAREAMMRELEQRVRRFSEFARSTEDQEIPEAWLEELRDLGYVR